MSTSIYKVEYECDCGVDYGICEAKCAIIIKSNNSTDIYSVYHTDSHLHKGDKQPKTTLGGLDVFGESYFKALQTALNLEESNGSTLTESEREVVFEHVKHSPKTGIPSAVHTAVEQIVHNAKIKGDLCKTANPSPQIDQCYIDQMAGLEEYQFRVFSTAGFSGSSVEPTPFIDVHFQAFKGIQPFQVFVHHRFERTSQVQNIDFNKRYTHSELSELFK